MDIQHLVDRLEDLIDEGRHLPMTKLTVIDEERALEIIDQMRISVPEEVDKATRLINQRDRLLAQANEEAARIVDMAKEKGENLITRDAITQAAQSRAANIIEQARQEAEQIRQDADGYVLEVLNELERNLVKTLAQVRNGINKLMADRDAYRQRAEVNLRQAVAEVNTPPSKSAATPTDVVASINAQENVPASTPAPTISKPADRPSDRIPERRSKTPPAVEPNEPRNAESRIENRVEISVDSE